MSRPLALYIPTCPFVLVFWVSWPIGKPYSRVINALLNENCVPEQEGLLELKRPFIRPLDTLSVST